MILYLLEEYKLFTCGLLMFQISTMANFETEFMHFWSFLTRPGDKHDEGISKCTLTPLQAGPSSRFSRFCRESHNFLTFLTTRLPISWILKKTSFWNETFLRLNKSGNVYCFWIVIDCRQLETSRRFCETLNIALRLLVGHMFPKWVEVPLLPTKPQIYLSILHK